MRMWLVGCSVLSSIRLLATSWTAARLASLSFTISPSWLRPMSIESVMPSNHLILCHPLLLPSVFPSIRVFSNESDLCIRWPKYWSFSFSISPSNEYSGLISCRIDWLDLFAVQETLKSLLQHQPVWKHKFFSAQPCLWANSHLYVTTGRTIALSIRTFVSKVMTLLFNMLSRFIIAFLPRSKHLLNLEPKKIDMIIFQWLRASSAGDADQSVVGELRLYKSCSSVKGKKNQGIWQVEVMWWWWWWYRWCYKGCDGGGAVDVGCVADGSRSEGGFGGVVMALVVVMVMMMVMRMVEVEVEVVFWR